MAQRFEAVHDFQPITNGEIELRQVWSMLLVLGGGGAPAESSVIKLFKLSIILSSEILKLNVVS